MRRKAAAGLLGAALLGAAGVLLVAGCSDRPPSGTAAAGGTVYLLPPKPATDIWPDVAPFGPAAEAAARQEVGVMVGYQLVMRDDAVAARDASQGDPGEDGTAVKGTAVKAAGVKAAGVTAAGVKGTAATGKSVSAQVVRSWNKGFVALKRHAYQGNPVAQTAVCLLYKWHRGTPADGGTAMGAALGGATQEGGAAQVGGTQAVLSRRETAIDWCRAAAERGYARGQVALGQLLMGRPATMGWPSMGWTGEGDGRQQQGVQQQGLALLAAADPAGRTEAVHWFRQAAAQGDAMGRLELARAYAEGRGVAQDPETAAQLLAPLAASARPDGEYARALIARYGLGARRSTGLANRALQQSADGNFWLAQADLAALYAGEDDGSADDSDGGAGTGSLILGNRTGGTKAGNGTVTGGAMSGTAAKASTGISTAAVSGEAALPRDPDLATYWRAKAERGDLDSAFFPLRLP